MSDSTLLPIALIAMFVALMVSLVPFVPGPAMLWAIAIITAILGDFNRITIPAVALMTILMVAGSTMDFWLRSLGMRSQGTSCWGIAGSLVGGILGTAVMPVIGTLIGVILGALLVELMRLGELRQALRAGKSAFTTFLLAMILEQFFNLGIFLTFLASILLTR